MMRVGRRCLSTAEIAGEMPSGTPIETASITEKRPAESEARAPQIIRARMSRPSSSVPIGWAQVGGFADRRPYCLIDRRDRQQRRREGGR